MTFQHTRTAGALTSRCTLCGHTIASRDERDVYLGQRSHDPFTCQQRRLEAARALATEVPDLCPNGHDRARNTHIDNRGWIVCDACRRDVYAAKKMAHQSCVSQVMATGLGVALGRIEASGEAPDLTPKPLLNTPTRRSILMQNNSASATPRQNSGGVA